MQVDLVFGEDAVEQLRVEDRAYVMLSHLRRQFRGKRGQVERDDRPLRIARESLNETMPNFTAGPCNENDRFARHRCAVGRNGESRIDQAWRAGERELPGGTPSNPLTPALSPEAGEREKNPSSASFSLSPASGERAGVRGLLGVPPGNSLSPARPDDNYQVLHLYPISDK